MAIWGAVSFFVFPPYTLRAKKGVARRWKLNRALNLELFAGAIFAFFEN
jgi:hypothetical protein